MVEEARCSFTYQITDMPLLSTLYEPLSKQLISVLGTSLCRPAFSVAKRYALCAQSLR